MSGQVFCGDAYDLLRTLPDDSIDLILTDPPWGTSRLKMDDHGRPPPRVWAECARVAKPAAWLFCFGTLRMWADILSAGYFEPYFEYIWFKLKRPPNMHTARRPTHAHESCQVLHGPAPASERYYDAKSLRTYGYENYKRYVSLIKPTTYHVENGYSNRRFGERHLDGSRTATTMLFYPNKGAMPRRERTDHPTQKPTEMLRYFIRGYCPPGGTVLDPYAGSGSTLVAARALGRRYVGAEIDPAWHALCERRLTSVMDFGAPNVCSPDIEGAPAHA